MHYDYSIDNHIYEALDSETRISFNKTRRSINSSRISDNKKTVTVRTLKMHLRKMKEQEIIFGDPPLPGHKGYYQFTDDALVTRKLGIFDGVQSNRNEKYLMEESKNKAKKKAIILLLTIGSTGATRLKRTLKARAGDIEKRNILTGKPETFEVYHTSGIAQEDMTKSNIFDYRRKFIPKNISEEVIQDLIDVLSEEKIQLYDKEGTLISDFPVLIRDSFQNGEVIYRIQDDKLRKFFTICQEILRMEIVWTFVRRHKREEIRWYNDLVGKENTISFLEEEKPKRKDRSKKFTDLLFQGRMVTENQKKHLEKSIENEVQAYDALIIDRVKELDEYHDYLYKNFRTLCNIVVNVAYPKYLKQLHSHEKL